jgi:hypothetical protein
MISFPPPAPPDYQMSIYDLGETRVILVRCAQPMPPEALRDMVPAEAKRGGSESLEGPYLRIVCPSGSDVPERVHAALQLHGSVLRRQLSSAGVDRCCNIVDVVDFFLMKNNACTLFVPHCSFLTHGDSCLESAHKMDRLPQRIKIGVNPSRIAVSLSLQQCPQSS